MFFVLGNEGRRLTGAQSKPHSELAKSLSHPSVHLALWNKHQEPFPRSVTKPAACRWGPSSQSRSGTLRVVRRVCFTRVTSGFLWRPRSFHLIFHVYCVSQMELSANLNYESMKKYAAAKSYTLRSIMLISHLSACNTRGLNTDVSVCM